MQKLSDFYPSTGGVTAEIERPSITSPSDNDTNLVPPFNVTLTAFTMTPSSAIPDTQKAIKVDVLDDGMQLIKTISTASGSTISITDNDVVEDTTYYLQGYYEGNALGDSKKSDPIKITTAEAFAAIIGVVMLEEGNDGGVWSHIDANGDLIASPNTAFFDGLDPWDIIQETVDSQHMMKCKRFWVKHGYINVSGYGSRPAWWIADAPTAGFHIHPAFMESESEINHFWVGKYQASESSGKLQSIPDVLPKANETIGTFQGYAAARNTGGVSGFSLWHFWMWSAIQYLYLVENATMDSQAKTGNGRVSENSAAKVDAADVAEATYRGIVGLWGNVRQWMDGLKFESGDLHVWNTNGKRTWVDTGKQRTASSGTIYPLTFMEQSGNGYNFADAFIGDTGLSSNSGATLPDYQNIDHSGTRFPSVGGSWSIADNAGLWSLNSSTSSIANTNIGSRLAKV